MIRIVLLAALSLTAVDQAAAQRTGRGFDMDYGPALAYTVEATNETVIKGVTVRLSVGTNVGAVLFDTETLRYAAAWSDGWLDLSKTHLTSYKGELPPRREGDVHFTTTSGPGWARDGSFADPRAEGIGPLPREWARYRGFYRYGNNVVFHYTVGEADVLDMPGMIEAAGAVFFTRTLRIGPSVETLVARLRDRQCPDNDTPPGNQLEPCAMVALQQSDGEVVTRVIDGEVRATIAPRDRSITVKLVFLRPDNGGKVPFEELDGAPIPDLPDVTRGGPGLWPKTISGRGRRGVGSGAYVVDSLYVPENNPWRSWMRLTAFDFFSDGRAAVTTWNGDVWIVSGNDDSLGNVIWKRFAAGMFDPLGLKIVNDTVYVLERSQITRLHDFNRDGEADYYENFNHDTGVSPSYHAFAMDLQTDRAGNFYFARAGQRVDPKYPMNGGIVRVSADGSQAELIAHGIRVANGMAVGPNDEIVCGDNQGNWIPSSRLNLIRLGGFYGFVPHAHGLPTNTYEPPLCWIPMSIDNSSGGQVWATSDRWGPLQGQLLHTSYGMASLFSVLWETVDGVAQGGIVKFPLRFDSGIQRARFNPRDGQLYVAGLRGWQTKGIRDGGLYRVRYTGAPAHMPRALHVRSEGIEITFTEPLDRASAEDLQSYSLEQWNYWWSDKYGSDDFSVSDPEKKGHDVVDVSGVRLSEDGKTVRLTIPSLQPVMQMKIKFALKAAEGGRVDGEIYNTIHRIPAK